MAGCAVSGDVGVVATEDLAGGPLVHPGGDAACESGGGCDGDGLFGELPCSEGVDGAFGDLGALRASFGVGADEHGAAVLVGVQPEGVAEAGPLRGVGALSRIRTCINHVIRLYGGYAGWSSSVSFHHHRVAEGCAPGTGCHAECSDAFVVRSMKTGAIAAGSCAFRRRRRRCRFLRRSLGWHLPAARSAPNFEADARRPAPSTDFPDLALRCSLRACGELTLEPLGGDADRRRWESMMETHHPQGWARAPGGQLRYWIRSATHGCLGGIGFSSAGWHQQARDAFIGWSPDARAANLPRVVCNHRFLILPGVRVHGLASRVLRMASDRLAEDWQAAYAVRPVMAFTYISPGYSGRCYRAARWRCCPQRTEGRRPDCAGEAPGVRRSVWMKPLSAGWREALRRAPKRTIGTAPSLYLDADTDWACREYGRSTHTDGRVRDRIVRMGRAWLRHLGESLPVIFPARAEQKAAYRLLSNEKVSMEHILEPHREMLVERCRLEPTVLAIQDTTTLNYDGLEATGGLDGLGGGGKGTSGILAHTGLAVTLAGRPLGLFELNAAFRSGKTADGMEPGPEVDEKESARWLRGLDRAQELAAACPRNAGGQYLRSRGGFLGTAMQGGIRRRQAAGARQPFGATAGGPGRRPESGSVGAPRRAAAIGDADAGTGRVRGQAHPQKAHSAHRHPRHRSEAGGAAGRRRPAAGPHARGVGNRNAQQEERPALAVAHHRRPRQLPAPNAAPKRRPPGLAILWRPRRPPSAGMCCDGPSSSSSRR